MTWNEVTLEMYQKIHPVLQNDWNDYDKFKEIIYIVTGKYEDVYKWSEDQIKSYSFIFQNDFDKNMPKIFRANKRFYRINLDIDKLIAARYIEIKTFYSNGYVENMHRIIASFTIPVQRWGFKYRDLKYDATKHEQYSNDILKLPFPIACALAMHTLNIINVIDKKYPNLFGQNEHDDQDGQMDIEQVFSKYYGWIFSTTQVAEHERITLDQAFELPVMQYLNDLAYIKMKNKLERKQIENINKKK